MSELALVSVRRARLTVLGAAGRRRRGHRAPAVGGSAALPADGADRDHLGQRAGRRVRRRADRRRGWSAWLETFPVLRPFAGSIAFTIVVVLTTYLTLVVGELVPKQLALRQPERVSAVGCAGPLLVAGAGRRARSCGCWASPPTLVLRLFGAPRRATGRVTEEELKAVHGRGRAGGRAGDGGARDDRAPAAARGQAGARDHDAADRAGLDRPHATPKRHRGHACARRRTAASSCATARSTTWSAWCRRRTLLDRLLGGERPVDRARRCSSRW